VPNSDEALSLIKPEPSDSQMLLQPEVLRLLKRTDLAGLLDAGKNEPFMIRLLVNGAQE
jgi:hypothetical protein